MKFTCLQSIQDFWQAWPLVCLVLPAPPYQQGQALVGLRWNSRSHFGLSQQIENLAARFICKRKLGCLHFPEQYAKGEDVHLRLVEVALGFVVVLIWSFNSMFNYCSIILGLPNFWSAPIGKHIVSMQSLAIFLQRREPKVSNLHSHIAHVHKDVLRRQMRMSNNNLISTLADQLLNLV